MADFVKDSINRANGQPQVLTQEEAATLRKEYGSELFDDLLKKNTIAIEENTKAIKDMQTQEKKSISENQKQVKSLKDFFTGLNDKALGRIEKLNLSYEKLKAPTNVEQVFGSAVNNVKQFGNYLKDFGGTLGAIGDRLNMIVTVAEKGFQFSMALDKNQAENNKLFLQTRGLSALVGSQYYNKKVTSFENMLADVAGSRFNIEKEVKPTLTNMAQFYNVANLSDQALKNRLTSTLQYNANNPQLSDIYNIMSGQSGGSDTFIKGTLSLFTKSFEHNNLGLDKSLQQTKALYESNRRFNMSMGEAAGYIQKFNKQLQDGTLTLQDLTTMRNTVKNASLGQNAGLGQMLLNAGLGTPKLLAAAGNPAKMAAVLREGGKEELDAVQKLFWDIASSTGLGTDRKAMGETLRNLYGQFGFNLSEKQVELISQGRNYSLQSGSLTPKSSQQQIDLANELQNVLDNNIDKTKTVLETLGNYLDKGSTKFLNAVNKFQSSVEQAARTGQIYTDDENIQLKARLTGRVDTTY